MEYQRHSQCFQNAGNIAFAHSNKIKNDPLLLMIIANPVYTSYSLNNLNWLEKLIRVSW